ncbi:DUF5990 family protein [Streptomyces sp. NPDC051662]|uniref:DUF5990 family protein n=1 Tax=Streptomyces sp. NPDC051662 TaxID=3154750 RepID=UPI00343A7FF6
MARLTLRITGRELPGRACGCFQEVHVAPQRGRVPDPDQLVRADAAEAHFEIPVDTTTAPALTDAKGLPRCAGLRPPELVWRAAPGTRDG